MDLERREFLNKAWKMGGLVALVSLGIPHKEIDAFFGSQSLTAMIAVSGNGGGTLIDSYSETNVDDDGALYLASAYHDGQAITLAADETITSCKRYLKKFGAPTGNMYVELFACTGTPGTDGKPTGSAVATSDALLIQDLTTSYQLTEFTFSTPYAASAGNICLGVYFPGGDASNHLFEGRDSSTPTHSGNLWYGTAADFYSNAGYDVCFYLYGS